MKITPRADNMTQDNAIDFWNDRNMPMVSMAFVWQLQKENSEEDIEEIRKDWKGFNWQLTSTRIIYDVSSLKGKVIHNFGSEATKPIEIELNNIPICSPTYLDNLLESESGINYVRALINNMKATKEEIEKGFEKLSGKKPKKIRLWTPTEKERLNKRFRAVRLYFDCVGFDVGGVVWVDVYSGLSRGVNVSAPKEQGKSKQNNSFKEGYNKAIADMIIKLEKLKLELHKTKSKILTLDKGITFLGFRNFYYHRLLRKTNIINMKKKIEKESNYDSLCEYLEGWLAYASHANTYNLRHRIADIVESNFKGNISSLHLDRLIKQTERGMC